MKLAVNINKKDCDIYWHVANPLWEIGIPAEICAEGNIKIKFNVLDLACKYVDDVDLALFYRKERVQYYGSSGSDMWYPVMFNARLL